MYMWIFNIRLLTKWGGDVVPFPGRLFRVRASWPRKNSSYWRRGELLRDLPNTSFRMVRKQHQVLLIIHIKRGVFVLFLDEYSAQILHLFRHRVVMINCLVNFVFCTWAVLHGCVVLFVALELYWCIFFPHATSPWRWFTGVNVYWCRIFPTVALWAHLIFVLENLDTWKQWALNNASSAVSTKILDWSLHQAQQWNDL